MRTEATLPGRETALREPPGHARPGPSHEPPPVVAPPAGHPRFPLIDSLRAVAALSVLLAHAMLLSGQPAPPHTWPQKLFGNGIQGVTVFFVISGFLLYRPFVNTALNGAPAARLRDYFRRRVLRIVPAYWLALTLLAIYPGLAGVFTGDWWRYYFLLSGYSDATVSHGLLVSWSLGVEVTFYLALPFYAILIARLTRGMARAQAVRTQLAALALLAAGSTLLRYLDYRDGPSAAIQNSLPGLFLWFALGMALAVISAHRPDLRGGRRPGLFWAGALLAYVGIVLIDGNDSAFTPAQEILGYYLLGGVMSVLLVAPAIFPGSGDRTGWPGRVLAWRPLAWAGLVSYGIYLWHVPVITDLYDHVTRPFVPLALLAGATVIALAAASYYLLERPILRFK